MENGTESFIQVQYYSNEQTNVPAQQIQPQQGQIASTQAPPQAPVTTQEALTSDFVFALQAVAIVFFLWAAVTWKKKWQQADYISAFIPVVIGFGLLYFANSI